MRRAYYVVKKIESNFSIQKHKKLVQIKLIQDIQKLISIIGDNKVLNTYYCFDNTSFRYLIREDYKGTREGGDDIDIIFNEFEQYLRLKKQNIVKIFGLEADDNIALLCEKFKDDYSIIITADKDLQQLVNDKTFVLIPHNAQRKLVQSKFSLPFQLNNIPVETVDPWFVLVEKILKGCKSDNIKPIVPRGFRTKKIEEISKQIRNIGDITHIKSILSKYDIDIRDLSDQMKMVCLQSKFFPPTLVEEFNKIKMLYYNKLRNIF